MCKVIMTSIWLVIGDTVREKKKTHLLIAEERSQGLMGHEEPAAL